MFENKNLKPMLLKEISVPFNDDNYLYEIKFDGIKNCYIKKNMVLLIKIILFLRVEMEKY